MVRMRKCIKPRSATGIPKITEYELLRTKPQSEKDGRKVLTLHGGITFK